MLARNCAMSIHPSVSAAPFNFEFTCELYSSRALEICTTNTDLHNVLEHPSGFTFVGSPRLDVATFVHEDI